MSARMLPAHGPILLVEDDADLRDVLVELLSLEGFQVEGAANGAEALDWLARGERPALVLLDFWMPKMNGQAFLERVGAHPGLAGVPVVAITTSPLEHTAVRATLRKPFDMASLVATVRQLLDAPSARR
jgi:CheY-like chemotaxis protein